MAKPLILNLDSLPLRAHRRLGPTGRMLAKQDGMRSKFFGMTHFRKNASVNPLESHTNKKPCIYVKTMGFKPFGDTYLQGAFSQSLLNHILIKKCDRGGGCPSYFLYLLYVHYLLYLQPPGAYLPRAIISVPSRGLVKVSRA